MEDLSGTFRVVLTIVAGILTGGFVYLILIHGGVFTLGRHCAATDRGQPSLVRRATHRDA